MDKFLEFQRRLQNEILALEFKRKVEAAAEAPDDSCSDPRISEMDFAELLIAYAGFSAKKKAKMLKRVKRGFGKKKVAGEGGMSIKDYLNFYQVKYQTCDLTGIEPSPVTFW